MSRSRALAGACVAAAAIGCDSPRARVAPTPSIAASSAPVAIEPPDASLADAARADPPSFDVVATAGPSQHIGLFPVTGGEAAVAGVAVLGIVRDGELSDDSAALRAIGAAQLQSSAIARVAGAWPDAMWLERIGFGGTYTGATPLLRWDDARRVLAPTTRRAPLAIARWRGGRLLALDATPASGSSLCEPRSLSVIAGAPASTPTIDPSFLPDALFASDDGAVLAIGERCDAGNPQGWYYSYWPNGAGRAAVEPLPLSYSFTFPPWLELEPYIAARNAADVWMAGRRPGDPGGTALAHFDGTTWRFVDPPSECGAPALSPSGTLYCYGSGALFRRNAEDGSWARIPIRVRAPSGAVTEPSIEGRVWARADDDLWIVADGMLLRSKPRHGAPVAFADASRAQSDLFDLEPPTIATSKCASQSFVSLAVAPEGDAGSYDFAKERGALGALTERVQTATLWKRRHLGVATSYEDAVAISRAVAKARGGGAPKIYCRAVALDER